MAGRSRRRLLTKPLPQRLGIDPISLRLPLEFPEDLRARVDTPTPTIAQYLIARFYPDTPEVVNRLFHRREVVAGDGVPLPVDAPFEGGLTIWYYRELSQEPQLPDDIPVLYEDEWILVVDKPHFLPTTPRGMFVAQTALTKLRVQHQNPLLSPVHRLDRATAGVLVFSKVPQSRGPFQTLFQSRRIVKEYEAVAPLIPQLEGSASPWQVVRSHIVKNRQQVQVIQHSEQQCLSLGLEPNALSEVELVRSIHYSTEQLHQLRLEHNPRLVAPNSRNLYGVYRLKPHSGKTHQLRAHMLLLGAPILGDTLYPTVCHEFPDEQNLPLQLLAKRISLRHPLTGEDLVVTSSRTLALAQ
ncbi:pseudouridine synthase [Rothia sp. P7208]|uniref:pseudouridine synthase n=1 Tax=Rothia sp. P7208 TaxID=3402660 RepID=UPI003AD6DF4F